MYFPNKTIFKSYNTHEILTKKKKDFDNLARDPQGLELGILRLVEEKTKKMKKVANWSFQDERQKAIIKERQRKERSKNLLNTENREVNTGLKEMKNIKPEDIHFKQRSVNKNDQTARAKLAFS
jgi:phage/plasmid-associated DNA primase